MTDEELSAVREFAGDLLVRAFRGEVDLATGLAEIRDLTPDELFEEAELPDDLDDELKSDAEPGAKVEPYEVDASLEADLSAALNTALHG